AEAVQTVMRRYGLPEPYEALKALTRGQALGPLQLAGVVAGLGLPAEALDRLQGLTPATYVGLAAQLVRYARG
ncbi:MAG: adenylosuccinate lyase, partial [Acidimicrobiales bacterium]